MNVGTMCMDSLRVSEDDVKMIMSTGDLHIMTMAKGIFDVCWKIRSFLAF